jgi:hypothetical protein
MQRLSYRILAFSLLCLSLAILAGASLSASGQVLNRAVAGTGSHPLLQPSLACSYSPLSLILTGSGNVEDVRAFSTVPGESYFQFAPADPITTTGISSGAALLNHTLSGSISGGMSGSFLMSNLNGMAITGSTVDSNARGFETNSMVINDSQGSFTLLLTFNFEADTATAPYYPRTINGYVQSTSSTGAYAQLKLAGTIIGTLGVPSSGSVPINASIQARLFSVPPAATRNRRTNASRTLPAKHAFSLSPSDMIAQFYRPDIQANASGGNFTPNAVFTGILREGSNQVGTSSIDHAQLIAGSQLDFSPGWAVGNWRMYEAQGNAYGPFLADQNGPFPNGYFFQAGGDGAYGESLLVETLFVTIGYQGGQDLTADPTGGYYCSGFTPTQPLLVGHVNWEARPSQPSQLQSLPITLTLKSDTSEVNYQTQLTDQYGYFTTTLNGLPSGTYSWRVDDATSALHSPNYLSASGLVDITSDPSTHVEMGLVRAGDATNDNVINIADFNLLKLSFGFACGNPLYDNRTDFTGDCTINVADFNPLKRNFGQTGAPPIGPR